MFGQEYDALSNSAVAKRNLLQKNPLGYLLLSALAGMFIGFGNLLTNVEGGLLNGAPYTKIVMGVSFGVALSLVVMAGAELFTGNNLVMMSGVLKKKIRIGDACKVWIVCWIGNLLGAIVLALLFHFCKGLCTYFLHNSNHNRGRRKQQCCHQQLSKQPV